MKKLFTNGQKLAMFFLFGTFSMVQAQTNLQVIDRQDGNVEQEIRSLTEDEKQILEQLLKSMGVEESVDQVLETKNIKIILEDKEQTAHHLMRRHIPYVFHTSPTNSGGFLGVYFQIKEGQGVEITEVISGTAAEEMGLKTGDIIKSINDEKVAENFSQVISSSKPNEAINLVVLRADKEIIVQGNLGERSKQSSVHVPRFNNIEKMENIEIAPISKPMLGVMLGYVANQVSIDGLIENSPATAMDLQSGDILKKINGEKINSIEDVKSKISEIEVGEKIKVLIVRDGKKMRKSAEMTEVSYRPKSMHQKRIIERKSEIESNKERIEENLNRARFMEKYSQFERLSPRIMGLANSQVFIISKGNLETKEVIIETNEAEAGEDNRRVEIYPNPTSGTLNISFQSQKNANTNVKVYDANNKLVFEKSYNGTGALIQDKVNINEQSPGLYIIHIEQGGELEVERVILEK